MLESLAHSQKITAFDNAMAGSFFATLEREVLNRRRFRSQAEAKMAVIAWIEGWYNPHRRRSGLGYRSPVNYERAHHQARSRMAEHLPPSAADSLPNKMSEAA
jgi:putative transposase